MKFEYNIIVWIIFYLRVSFCNACIVYQDIQFIVKFLENQLDTALNTGLITDIQRNNMALASQGNNVVIYTEVISISLQQTNIY